MKININDIPKVLHTYVRQQVVPKIPSSPWQFLVGLGNTYIVNLGIDNKISSFLPNYYDMLKKLGIIDDQNMIDLDKLHENSLIALDDCTGHSISFDIFDGKRYTMNQNDIEELYQIATRYGVNVEPPKQPQQSQPILKPIETTRV